MSTATEKTPTVEPITSPFTVLVDSREQAPFLFHGLKADAKDGNRPIIVQTKVVGLKSGDYSRENCEDKIAIERKSFEDLFSTLGHGRKRFEAELARLNAMQFAAIVCECSWRDVAYCQPLYSRMNSKSVVRSIIAFSMRYPRVHWFMCPGREFAEVMCFRLLERHWKDEQEASK